MLQILEELEKSTVCFGVCLIGLFWLASAALAQESPSNDEFAPLVLVRIIPMTDVQGRFDHMGVDAKTNRVFAPVYGNDSVEVLDVARGKRIHSLQSGFIKPQMVLYIPEMNRFVVSKRATAPARSSMPTPTS